MRFFLKVHLKCLVDSRFQYGVVYQSRFWIAGHLGNNLWFAFAGRNLQAAWKLRADVEFWEGGRELASPRWDFPQEGSEQDTIAATPRRVTAVANRMNPKLPVSLGHPFNSSPGGSIGLA